MHARLLDAFIHVRFLSVVSTMNIENLEELTDPDPEVDQTAKVVMQPNWHDCREWQPNHSWRLLYINTCDYMTQAYYELSVRPPLHKHWTFALLPPLVSCRSASTSLSPGWDCPGDHLSRDSHPITTKDNNITIMLTDKLYCEQWSILCSLWVLMISRSFITPWGTNVYVPYRMGFNRVVYDCSMAKFYKFNDYKL